MAAAAPGQPLRFIIEVHGQANLTELPENSSLTARRAALVQLLQNTAAAAQSPLLPHLNTLRQTSHIHTYRPLWIVNAIAATGTADAIHALAAQPEVAAIRPDAVVDYFQPPDPDHLHALLQEAEIAHGAARSWGIERIGAPQTWYGLGVDGQGVTVAIMDSGVDFQHPDLIDNYRGNLGNGNFEHDGNWYNAAYPTVTVPTDTLGHGTHVAGTAVGANGIGVAPGAQWIAVNIGREGGYIFTSDTHAGFEWLLAPGNNPALAPDIVNGSWGGDGAVTEFVADMDALRLAGIIPVFAAGNSGPFPQTVGFPASYTNTLSVGASDDLDEVAWFSSRGPSFFNDEIKPWVVAPGTRILSSLPGGIYGYYNGTSMAAPHTSGAIALLLAANPALGSQTAVMPILANTAVPISTTHPNMESGWGRLDVYAAVQTQVATGRLAGTVFAGGVPLPHAVFTVTTAVGEAMVFQSGETGAYEAHLLPGNYTVSASFFAHEPYQAAVTVQLNQTTNHAINLIPLPTGAIEGVVVEANSLQPLAGAHLQVQGTPLEVVTDADGRYTLGLPTGTYKLIARIDHFRLGRATVQPVVGQTTVQNFWLAPGPMTLLLDTGQWYYQSQAVYYQESLTALDYAYDTWTVRHPARDIPTDSVLANYDNVIWAAPKDSPGVLGMNNVITNYIGQGGNLFISGERVGQFDGYGFGTQLWWYRDLGANFLGQTYPTYTIHGADNSLFTGLSLTLNGGSSANNQTFPDVSEPRRGSLTEAPLYFADGYAAGLQSGRCWPGRIVYLGFGLEGVTEAGDRNALLERSLAYFAAPPTAFGVHFTGYPIDDFALAGTHMVYTLTVQNLSETMTDTFTLADVNTGWQTSLVTTTLTLGPCQSGRTVLHIDVPAEAPKDSFHTTQVTAVSGNNPAVYNYVLVHHKTPGQLLFVDDDRWHDEDIHLTGALEANGLAYDVWETGWRDGYRRGSPPQALLLQYDFIIWYTGYDWFAPVLPGELEDLTAYLAQGGRLFLTSQDFLYHHRHTPLAKEYLGVLGFRESVTPTRAYGGSQPAVGPDLAGPLRLDRGRYLNNGDGLIPSAASQPFFWHDSGMPAGLATAGETWRAIFWGIPFEWLPDDKEAAVMNRIMGWLGDLGESTFAVDARVDTAVSTRTYTITLRNTPTALANQVQMVNTLPPALTILPNSITGGAVYDSAAHQLAWSGTLPSGGQRLITYQTIPQIPLAPGTAVTNQLTIRYNRHNLQFDRTAVYWVDAPDLSASTFTAVPNQPNGASQVIYLFTLRNSGLTVATNISAYMRLPDDLTILTGTLLATAGVTWLEGRHVYWQGDLSPGQFAMVRIVTRRQVDRRDQWLPALAVIQDGVTGTVLKEQLLHLPPYKQYLPLTIQK